MDQPTNRTAFQGWDVERSLTASPQRSEPPKRRVPPKITSIILDLGFRYRPASAEQQSQHDYAVDLLAKDVAHVPPQWLEVAVAKWVAQSRYMPRAADLIKLAQDAQRGETSSDVVGKGMAYWASWCREANNRLASEGANPEMQRRWVPKAFGGATIMWLSEYEREMRRAADMIGEGDPNRKPDAGFAAMLA